MKKRRPNRQIPEFFMGWTSPACWQIQVVLPEGLMATRYARVHGNEVQLQLENTVSHITKIFDSATHNTLENIMWEFGNFIESGIKTATISPISESRVSCA